MKENGTAKRLHELDTEQGPETKIGDEGGGTDWNEVRRLYLETDTPIAVITKRFGFSAATLYRRIERNGWLLRTKRGKSDHKRKSPAFERTNITSASDFATLSHVPPDRGVMVARLYSVLDQQMRDLQERLAASGGDVPHAAEAERDARTLSTLARLLERLTEMERSDTEQDQPVGAPDDEPPKDIDAFRNELTQRLNELQKRKDN